MENLIKKRFVSQILQEEGERLVKNQGTVLGKRLKFHTGRLAANRLINISESEYIDGQLTFRHLSYERFLDMKRTVNRKRKAGTRVKHGYRIHNRFMYGTYFSIAKRLMYDLTDEVKANIINEIKSGNNG